MGPPSWPVAFSTTASLLEMLTAGMGLGCCCYGYCWLWDDGTASSSAPTHRRHRKKANRKWTLSAGAGTNTHTKDTNFMALYSGRCFFLLRLKFPVTGEFASSRNPALQGFSLANLQPSRCARTSSSNTIAQRARKKAKKDAANLPGLKGTSSQQPSEFRSPVENFTICSLPVSPLV